MTDQTQHAGVLQRAGSQPGGVVLSVSLVLSAAISIAADLNSSHLFNPAWPPHAKFHDVAMLNLLIGACAVAGWLLWRRSREPDVAALVAWLVPVIFWSAFFWASSVIPGVSLLAYADEPPPQIAGVPVYPNLIVAFVLVFLSTFGLWRRLRSLSR